MITILIGIQTTCVAIASGYVISHFRPKGVKVKLHSNVKGFKHYKTF